jgi:hypothetical protein
MNDRFRIESTEYTDWGETNRRVYVLKDQYRGYYALQEQFTVAYDLAELQASRDDGIVLHHGKLIAIRHKGKVYEVSMDPNTSTMRVSEKGLGRNRPLKEIVATAAGKVAEEVTAALDYGSRRHLLATRFR